MARASKPVMFVLAIVMVGASCTSEPSGPQAGGSVTAYVAEFATLDPARCIETSCAEIVNRIFDSPVGYDPETAGLRPAAATSWEVSDDATQITFTLREGAVFHNGEPVTVESFIRGWSRAASAESEAAGNLDGIEGFAAVQAGESDTLSGVAEGDDPLTMVVTLDAPDPEFIQRMGHTVFSPVPADVDDDFADSPVGNGPYRLTGFARNESVSVEQFTDYNGDHPGFLEQITWIPFGDPETAYTEFQDGDLSVSIVPREQFDQAAEEFGDAFVKQATASDVLFMAAGTVDGPTSDPNFRRAISMAMDRDEIADVVGEQIPAQSYIPPATPGHRPGTCTYCVHNPDQAKTLLEAAGGAPSDPITIYAASPAHATWVEAARTQITETLGVQVETKTFDPGSDCSFFKSFLAISGPPSCGEPDAQRSFTSGFFILTWTQDSPTPGHWISLMESDQDLLFAGWQDEEYDSLAEEARSTIDEAARVNLFQQAEDRLLDQMPVLPMWYDASGLVYDDEVIGTFVIDVQSGAPSWEDIALA